jgi:carbamoyl-phosphate synthase/aspartate carbamoyltransferase/dihydroorotase
MKLLRLPGLIDVHVHLRDPGATQKEDFSSGTKAAVAGGFSAVLDMPNNPGAPVVSEKALRQKELIASKKAVCDYGLFFGASQNGNYTEFKKIIPRVCGLKVYMDTTTGDLLIENLQTLHTVFKYWESDKPIVTHAEDARLATAIGLASLYGRKLHIAHVSQKSELEVIIRAKQKGVRITCEVTPHHLFLTETDRNRLGPYGIMKPSLKSKSDVNFLWKNIQHIDCIGSDHAPHTKEEKESSHPPYGVPNLETTLPLLLTAVKEKRLSIQDIIRLLHTNPKKIFNLKVSADSFIEVDAKKSFEITNGHFFSKCGWSPYKGMNVFGKVIKTVVRGKTVFENGVISGKIGYGKNLFA